METRRTPVKGEERGVSRDRLDALLTLLSPWPDAKAISYERLGSLIGFSEDAVKKWFEREMLPHDAAVAIVRLGRELGIVGLTLDWLFFGDSAGPSRVPPTAPETPQGERSEPEGPPAGAQGKALAVGRAAGRTPKPKKDKEA